MAQKKSSQENIVFLDFDGVIADSLELAHQTTLLFEPDVTIPRYVQRFEGNIFDHPTVKNEERIKNYVAHYAPRLHEQPLFEGMREVLQELAELYTSVIVSSSTTSAVEEFLKTNQLEEHITSTLGHDVERSKHKKINMVLKEHKVPPEKTVMVTDTLGDLREATAAGVRGIAVLWGFHDHTTLQKGEPTAIAEAPADIISHTKKIFEI